MRAIRWAVNFASWEPTEQECCRAFAAIQEEERLRIHEFVYQADAKASLVGRLMIRKSVAQLLNITNKDVRLSRSVRGRPVLADISSQQRLEFNVSHAGAWTVIAANPILEDGAHMDLGVDIMPTKDRRVYKLTDFFRLMRRQFTDREWEVIEASSAEAERLVTFFRFWSLKESYVKAIGTGLTIDLKSVEFKLGKSLEREGEPVTDSKVSLNGVLSSEWTFEESQLGGDHCVAVAQRYTGGHCRCAQAWDVKTVADLLPERWDLIGEENPEDWRLFSSKARHKPF